MSENESIGSISKDLREQLDIAIKALEKISIVAKGWGADSDVAPIQKYQLGRLEDIARQGINNAWKAGGK